MLSCARCGDRGSVPAGGVGGISDGCKASNVKRCVPHALPTSPASLGCPPAGATWAELPVYLRVTTNVETGYLSDTPEEPRTDTQLCRAITVDSNEESPGSGYPYYLAEKKEATKGGRRGCTGAGECKDAGYVFPGAQAKRGSCPSPPGHGGRFGFSTFSSFSPPLGLGACGNHRLDNLVGVME